MCAQVHGFKELLNFLQSVFVEDLGGNRGGKPALLSTKYLYIYIEDESTIINASGLLKLDRIYEGNQLKSMQLMSNLLTKSEVPSSHLGFSGYSCLASPPAQPPPSFGQIT